MKRDLAKFVLTSMLFAGLAYPAGGGTPVLANQGSPGNQGPWPVTLSGGSAQDGGAIVTQNIACTNPVESVITFDGGGSTPCPVTSLAGRRTVTLCSSPKDTGTPLWTVRSDGVPTTAATSPGQALNKSDCIYYTIGATSSDGGPALNCISDTAGSHLLITECQ